VASSSPGPVPVLVLVPVDLLGNSDLDLEEVSYPPRAFVRAVVDAVAYIVVEPSERCSGPSSAFRVVAAYLAYSLGMRLEGMLGSSWWLVELSII